MKERPILFSSPMVRAILAGRKTQTRRVCQSIICTNVSDMPQHLTRYGAVATVHKCPYGAPGDRLWVRETTCIAPKNFATPDETCVRDYDGALRFVSYKADGHSEDAMRDYKLKWTPSIHVPRWASRITLEVVCVRVERLQSITEADAIAEGVEVTPVADLASRVLMFQNKGIHAPAVVAYADLWCRINGPDAWLSNPWVWVVEFKRVNTQTA